MYCLPNGYQSQKENHDSFLSIHEIRNLCCALAEMGMWKVRLTGGEPTLRRDLIEIVKTLKNIQGIKTIALSTNGYRLVQLASPLYKAGVSHLNVSVDSLNANQFKAMTGTDQLLEVLQGIDTALAEGFESVKINVVLLKGDFEADFLLFLEWIKAKSVVVRFIELMQTGQNLEFFKRYHTKSSEIQERLLQLGWTRKQRSDGDGPALEFKHPQFAGRIGLIAPYSKDFCSSCNRLRVTSKGELRLCLFGNGNDSLRHLLQRADQKEELQLFFRSVLQKKEISHYLPEGNYGNNQTFSAMGG